MSRDVHLASQLIHSKRLRKANLVTTVVQCPLSLRTERDCSAQSAEERCAALPAVKRIGLRNSLSGGSKGSSFPQSPCWVARESTHLGQGGCMELLPRHGNESRSWNASCHRREIMVAGGSCYCVYCGKLLGRYNAKSGIFILPQVDQPQVLGLRYFEVG
ncbi:hypothetical protein VTK56DRAFT_9657 [Thermocarpiscus australiensis]